MGNYFKFISLILLLFLISCSTVRNTKQVPQKTNQGKNNSSISKSNLTKQTKPRFSDTTTVIVPPATVSSQSSLAKQFDDAVANFDKEKFDIACEKFKVFSQTLDQNDSLFYESKFYICECHISKNEISQAESGLTELFTDKHVPKNIYERVLVRLGQVYCVQNKNHEAEELFLKLKKDFPKSIYIPLANCDVVK